MVHELNTLTVQVSKTESFSHPSWNVAELVGSIQFIGSMRLRERYWNLIIFLAVFLAPISRGTSFFHQASCHRMHYAVTGPKVMIPTMD